MCFFAAYFSLKICVQTTEPAGPQHSEIDLPISGPRVNVVAKSGNCDGLNFVSSSAQIYCVSGRTLEIAFCFYIRPSDVLCTGSAFINSRVHVVLNAVHIL